MADIVLVHGITESRATWDPLIAPLATINRVLAIDLRGHGSATKQAPFDLATMAVDALAAMADAGFNPSESVLIGHSLGGTVVSAMASAVPVRGVINIDQPLRLAGFQEGLRELEPMLRGDTATFEAAIGLVFDAMRGPLPPPEVARIESLRRPDQSVVLGVWEPVLNSSVDDLDALVRSMAAGIAAPYLSLHGIDPGQGYAEWLTALVPSATVEVWADHGHYPHLLEPQRFVERVESFIAALD